ncbi:hypothetical protein [Lysobacter enzymogenes]|uniref:DUF4064 domain-containing protein n=1 Tax=Lysobacter enzymogenes TaxID=69 RepID=A0AAU9AK57_LYSEN|nr:hypothetical protein [Lysobacter enzymogenes]BAV98991.1 conserved hypothetical protein [Lysobacter enzymogenes]
MGRTMVAVMAGLALAMATMLLFEAGYGLLHPLPAGAQAQDPATMSAHLAAAPLPALLLVLAGWVVGALDGGLLAALISRRHKRGAALAIGLLVTASVVAVTAMFAHPLWLLIAGVALPLPASWLGARLAQRRAAG